MLLPHTRAARPNVACRKRLHRKAKAEVVKLPIHDDYEQHRLLVMIEQMQREGLSEREITAAVRDATRYHAPTSQPSLAARPATSRLARWALERMSA
jgi:hypothetical protein